MVFLALIPTYLIGAGPVASAPYDDRLFRVVLGGSIDSWMMVAGSHPLVEDRGVVLLPPYLIGLLAGGLATSFALRSRSPAAPVVVPLVAFVAVQLLGRQEPNWLLGIGFAATAVAWMVLRGWRREVRSRLPALLTRLGLAAAVLATAAAVAQPVSARVDVDARSRLLLRDVVPAYDVSDVDTPLATFRRYTRAPPRILGNLYDRELLTVKGLPAGARLRFLALDTYDYKQFRPGDKTVPDREDDRFLRVGGTIDNPAGGEEHFVNVTVHKAWDHPWVPTAGAVQWFGFDGTRPAERLRGFRYNPATMTGVMTSDLTTQDDYEFATVLPDDGLSRELLPSPDMDLELFIQATFVDLAAHAWSEGSTSPMDAVYRAAETLRTIGRYSDGARGFEVKYRPGHQRRRLGPEFIYGSLTGNDEQYATVMALVANRLGVPARVVVGAVVPKGGVILGRHVEAWVELRVRDGSWRTLPTEMFMSRRPPEDDRFDVNPDKTIQLPPGTKLPQYEPPTPDFGKHTEQPSPVADAADDLGPAWWRRIPLVLALLLALAIGLVPVAKWWRGRRRLEADRVTMRYAGAWLEFVDLARDLGRPLPRGLTRPAEAELIGRGAGLAAEADRVIFGVTDPGPEQAAAYWEAVQAECRGLRADAGVLRRPFAWVNPASLRRRASAGRLRDRFELVAHPERELVT